MASEEEEIEDSQKTIFDWCRDGNIDVVEKMLTDSDVADINALDENVGLIQKLSFISKLIGVLFCFLTSGHVAFALELRQRSQRDCSTTSRQEGGRQHSGSIGSSFLLPPMK